MHVCERENQESWVVFFFFKKRKRPSALKADNTSECCRSHALCCLRGAQGGGSEGKQGVIRPRRELSTFLPERGHEITPTIINRAGSPLCWAARVRHLTALTVTGGGTGRKKFRLVQSILFQQSFARWTTSFS